MGVLCMGRCCVVLCLLAVACALFVGFALWALFERGLLPRCLWGFFVRPPLGAWAVLMPGLRGCIWFAL